MRRVHRRDGALRDFGGLSELIPDPPINRNAARLREAKAREGVVAARWKRLANSNYVECAKMIEGIDKIMQSAQELMQTSGTDLLQTVVEQSGQMKETMVGVLQDMTQLDAVQESFDQQPGAGPITNGQPVMPTEGEPVMPTVGRKTGGWDQQPRPELVDATMQALSQGERSLEEVGAELQQKWPVEEVEKAFDEGLEKGLWDISKKGMDLWLTLRSQTSTGARLVRAQEAPNVDFGKPYGGSGPSFETPQGPVWMFRKGGAVRFYDQQGQQVGPEQSNVAPAIAYAMSEGWKDLVGPSTAKLAYGEDAWDCPNCGARNDDPERCRRCKEPKPNEKQAGLRRQAWQPPSSPGSAGKDDFDLGYEAGLDSHESGINPDTLTTEQVTQGWPSVTDVGIFIEGVRSGVHDSGSPGGSPSYSGKVRGLHRQAEWVDPEGVEIGDKVHFLDDNGMDKMGTVKDIDEYGKFTILHEASGREYQTDYVMNKMSAKYPGDPRWITTKYPATCVKCNRQIAQGEEVFYYPNGKQIYCNQDGCGGDASRDFDAHAFDEDFGSFGARKLAQDDNQSFKAMLYGKEMDIWHTNEGWVYAPSGEYSSGGRFLVHEAWDIDRVKKTIEEGMGGQVLSAVFAVRLDPKEKQQVNSALVQAGMDGNGRFRDMNDVVATATQILDQNGLDLAMISAYEVQGPEGHKTFLVNKQGAGELDNSLLTIQWYTHDDEQVEAVAYMS